MFGFGEKKSSRKRDDVIGLIASTIDSLLPDMGYDKFSEGYISIGEGFKSAGWSSGGYISNSIFKFKVTDIDSIHYLLKDELFAAKSGIERTYLVDMYCIKVHSYLLENFREYRELEYLDARLS